MAAAPTAAGVIPATGPIEAQLARFTRHRCFNRSVAVALHRSIGTSGVGRDIANCAQRLLLEFPQEGEALGPAALVGARLCNRRLCPFCEWRRTRVWRARILQGLESYLQQHPKHRAVFLTLTVRNCQLSELRQTIQELHRSWKRMADQRWFPSPVWLRRTEVTVSGWEWVESTQLHEPNPSHAKMQKSWGAISVHPHLHVLMMVRPSYFGKDYIKHLRWQQEWQMAARLDYAPVVDVRVAKDRRKASEDGPVSPVSAVLEAAKYASKATDLMALGADLPEFHWQVKGQRFYGLSQELSRYIKAAEPDATELLDASRANDQGGPPVLSCVAEWIEAVQEYRIAP